MTGAGHRFLTRSEYVVGLMLASVHLLLCYWVFSSATEGSWGGFIVYLFDLPLSIPLTLVAQRLGGDGALIVGGTLWWFCVGAALSKGARFLISRLSARSGI
ncbi:MAG TPA: hypothetical protein VGK96_00965 [Candidatus Sulfotelmatobacter sp.]